MRRAPLRSLVLSALLAVLAVGCSEDTSETTLSPTAVAANGGNEKKGTLPEEAAPEAKINKLINALFPQPEKGDAHQLVGQIKDALDEGDTAAAQDAMFELLALLLGTDLNEPSDISKTEAVAQLTDLLFGFVGLPAPDIDPGLLADIEDGTVDGVVAVIHGDEDDIVVTPGTDMGGGQIGNTALLVPDDALPDDEDYLLVVQEVGSPCANTVFEQLPLCYEYETFPSPAVFTGLAEAKVAVCVDADPRDPALIQDSDGVVEVLPPRSHSDLSGFRCDPRGILVAAADDQANPLLQLARVIVRPVTHLFDPPPLVAIDVGGMAGSIGSIDTRYVGVIPQELEKISGDGQTAAPGSTLSPLVVRVSNPHSGAPVAGVNVIFALTGGGGSLSAATVSTDANGEASTTLTLGTATGTNTVEASAPGTNLTGDPADPAGPVTFTATAQQLPDLVVSNLTHSPTNPNENDQITFTAVVENVGSGPAGASTLMFKIGGETAGAPATLFSVPNLAAGATFAVQRQATLIPQNYINTATADWDDDVAESDENNNTTTDSYTVVSVIQD